MSLPCFLAKSAKIQDCVQKKSSIILRQLLYGEWCMKKWLLAGMILTMTVEMCGCTPGNNVPGATGAGALAGGLIGNELFHGKNAFAGVLAGALIGGIVGNRIGNYMDAQDKANMQNAITTVPVGQQATWTSANEGPNGQPVTYSVTPVRAYQTSSHRYCREYQTTVTVGGKVQRAYGHACRQPDGSWKIES
jgi:surface antigen